ncbi:Mom family adenine methylcarbamoylation protein [Bradyrhizobium hereditatis]|uniref:Mom family adenine methylcarbamoylation protein n=1 Tax=Bradyrhizobium hereditatis TaxID=2821405 RepID=UPI004062DAAA
MAGSRALSIALRMIKRHYPHIEWVISFADGCQCGDRTICRAAAFVLTGIKLNKSLLLLPNGSITHKMTQVTGKKRAAHFTNTGGLMVRPGRAARRPTDAIYLLSQTRGACAANRQRNPVCGDRAAWHGHVSRYCAWASRRWRGPSAQLRGSGDRHAQ